LATPQQAGPEHGIDQRDASGTAGL